MNKELYFDIVSDEWAGGLYRNTDETDKTIFYYHHSLSDLEDDNNKTTVTESYYPSFSAFWSKFTADDRWFTYHPLYIHPEQRPFVKKELTDVNWNMVAGEKWREMYKRQWNKTLNDPSEYYKPMK